MLINPTVSTNLTKSLILQEILTVIFRNMVCILSSFWIHLHMNMLYTEKSKIQSNVHSKLHYLPQEYISFFFKEDCHVQTETVRT